MDVEDLFITKDGATFRMIEDEWGDLFWGYGHREAAEFVGEVNSWLRHVGIFEDELIPADHCIDHLWVKFDEGRDGYFTVVEPHSFTSFPVTRLML